jgi:hypothetical protein
MSASEHELKRRECQLKRHEFLFKLHEAVLERTFKVSSTALIGNLAVLALFASIVRVDVNKTLITSLQASSSYFLLGALTTLLALGASFAMTLRRAEAFERLAKENFPDEATLYDEPKNIISRIVVFQVIPSMATLGIILSGFFFIIGLLDVLARVSH